VIFRAANTPATATEAVPGRERVREGDKHQGWVVKVVIGMVLHIYLSTKQNII
jgi:hypothetical protein